MKNMSEGHEHRQFFTSSLELNFFPVFSRVEFIPPPPGGGALLVKIFTKTFSLRKLSTKYFFLVDIHHFYGAASEPTSETMDGVIIWCILKRELSVAGSRQ